MIKQKNNNDLSIVKYIKSQIIIELSDHPLRYSFDTEKYNYMENPDLLSKVAKREHKLYDEIKKYLQNEIIAEERLIKFNAELKSVKINILKLQAISFN
ncbi:MAG: hypothetical protein ACOY46_02865 [Bacillota bacterium]